MVKFKFIDDKQDKRKILHDTGILLLKEILLDKFGLNISENDIIRNEHGKPYLSGHDDIFFSISHCDGLCCCMVCPSECGIDCEKIREYRSNVARRVFTDSELVWFNKLDMNEKSRFFFILWTLKEAYGKYTGKGIADMKNVSFSFENGVLTGNISALDFFIFEKNGYILSLCVEKGVQPECSFGTQINLQ